jgi:imidazoleglycerol-phosphate dehydratase
MKAVRETRETSVHIQLELTPGPATSRTGIRFLDHMLITLGRYAGWTLDVRGSGDLVHHLVEDVAITLGALLFRLTPDGIARYGHRVAPMDDALVAATLDAGGRSYYEGPLPSTLYDHFFRSFCQHAAVTLHVDVRRGRDRHHVVEAAFKAVGLSLHDALQPAASVFSTKGAVRLTIGPENGE